MTASALELCDCCEVEAAHPASRAGYCTQCEEAARAGHPCWHDEQVAVRADASWNRR